MNFIMKVGPCCSAGFSHKGDFFPSFDTLTAFHEELIQVGIGRFEAIAMINRKDFPVSVIRADRRYRDRHRVCRSRRV